jgi:two-component system, probable response regulator PhcQ
MFSILLLDDEPHVLSALRRTLRTPLGDQVSMETHTDPHEALARVGEHAFDLLITDFRMPAMNGVQFLRFARELQPHALRMVVSASTEINGVMSAINDVGVFRYVVKPWTTDVLVDDVRAALAESFAGREQRRLADAMRVETGEIGRTEAERRRLEELEPGLTDVQWGPNGEVLMPPLHSERS